LSDIQKSDTRTPHERPSFLQMSWKKQRPKGITNWHDLVHNIHKNRDFHNNKNSTTTNNYEKKKNIRIEKRRYY